MQTFMPSISRALCISLLTVSLGAGVSAGCAYAQTPAPEPAIAARSSLPQASLSASAGIKVPQDSVRISLGAQAADAQREKVSVSIDKILDSVLKQAKADGRVKVYSGNYHVWPVHNEAGRITGWQGRADVLLEGSDLKAAAELAGQLSDRMSVNNVNFFVSSQAREKVEAALLDQAAQAFRSRAQAITQAFGFHHFEIKSLSLDGGGVEYAPMPRMMAASAPQKSAVPLEPGDENVTVSVRGEVYLLPGNK